MTKPIIKIENLSKVYRLGEIGTGTLSHDLNRFWQMNILGKDDPYAKIGQVNDRTVKAEKSEHISALQDINLEVNQGDVLGIIGKNGAGKSTLLKILSRVTSPTTGSVKVKGRMASLLEVGTGFHPEMTGRENIYMNGTIMGMRRWEVARKLDEIVEFAGVAKYLDTPTKRYSSGMTVRLGFAIAAHLEPEILVVDEVLAVGDAEFQKKAIGKMQDVSQGEGRTVLFVSHNMTAVKNLCKTGVLLENGIVSYAGEIDDVIDCYIQDNKGIEIDSIDTMQQALAKLPNDPHIRLTNIQFIQNDKYISTQILNDKPLEIEITYEVLRQEKGLRVYIDLCDKYGEIILRSFNDEIGNEIPTVKFGKYISKVQIPANFLGATQYEIIVRATVYNACHCTGNGIKIPINVHNTGIYNKAYPKDPLRGKLGIVLKWGTIKL